MKGYRTLIVNVLLAIAPLWDLFIAPEVAAIIPAGYQKWYMLAIVVVNAGLRMVTTTPVGTK